MINVTPHRKIKRSDIEALREIAWRDGFCVYTIYYIYSILNISQINYGSLINKMKVFTT